MTKRIQKTLGLRVSRSLALALAVFAGFAMSAIVNARAEAQDVVKGKSGQATRRGGANFSDLAHQELNRPPGPQRVEPPKRRIKPQKLAPESIARAARAAFAPELSSSPPPLAASSFAGSPPPPTNPPPSASFQALPDDGRTLYPDTQGAVGPNHLMVTLNSQVRIQDRSGGTISTVTLNGFWSSLGNPSCFDPRVLYEPYNNRWIFVCAANAGTTNAALLVGVTRTSDPTGDWNLYSVDVDTARPIYAVSPNLGFNKDWIVVQADMYYRSNDSFYGSDIYVFNKTNLYANGSGLRTKFSREDTPESDIFGGEYPVATYDNTLGTNYLVQQRYGNQSSVGSLGIYGITGPVNSPTFELIVKFYTDDHPDGKPWESHSVNYDDILPQLGATNKIYGGDARILNAVYRNGELWAAHTVYLPIFAPTYAVAQWWNLSPGGFLAQQGRVEDPSGTIHYAFPSIAVSRNNDVVVGYSRFSASQYPSANYGFRLDADLFSTLRQDTVLKAGEAPFRVQSSSGTVYWGLYSGAVVDPLDDTDLWTVQQYAASPVTNSDRWGTWWGRISPPSDLTVTQSDSPDPVTATANLTYTVVVTNNRQASVSGVRLVDTLPAGITFVSAVSTLGACSQTNGVVTCEIGILTNRAKATVTIIASPNAVGTITNTATASANGPELTPADNTATATTTVIASADLAVLQTGVPDPVAATSNLTYTVIVTNRGPSTSANVILTNTLPSNVTFVSHTPTQGGCTRNGAVITCTLGAIAAQSIAQVAIVVTSPNSGVTITNQTRVVADTADLNSANNTSNLVTRVNANPTIQSLGNQTTNEDTTLGPLNFTVSDQETPAASLVVTAVSANQTLVPNGSITLGGSGGTRTITIRPATNQFGSAAITRTVTDADGASVSSTFTLTVNSVNDLPTITDIVSQPTPEDTSTTNISFTIGDVETPAASLTVTATSANQTIVPNANITLGGSGSNRTVTIQPATNQFGSATITVTVTDQNGGSASDSFLLTVSSVNDLPSISDIADRVTNEDTVTPAISLTIGDVETAASNLTVTAISDNQVLVPNGAITPGGGGSNRTVTILPATNQFGSANITVTVTDASGGGSSDSFVLTVLAVNDAPTLNQPPDVTINEDAGQQTVAVNGITAGATNETQALTVTVTSSNPSLVADPVVTYTSANTNATLTFTTLTNAHGTSIITVTVRDDGTTNNVIVRTFNLTANPVNDPPVISDTTDQATSEDTPTAAISFTIGDIETPAASLVVTRDSSNLALVPVANIVLGGSGSNRTATITPATNQFGSTTITLTVSDGTNSASDTFVLSVTSQNDLPVISDIVNQTINEDTASSAIAFTIGDVETAAASLTLSRGSTNQALVPDANIALGGSGSNRTVTITPAADQVGTTLITVTVTDGNSGSSSDTFLVTVLAVNDPPTLNTVTNRTIAEDSGQLTVVLAGITSGATNETQTLTVTATSSDTGIIPDPTVIYTSASSTGSVRFTPVTNANGTATITVRVNDNAGSNNLVTRTFDVVVTPVNDVPVISSISDRVTDEDQATSDIGFTIGDVESVAGTLTLEGSSSNDELVANTDIIFGGSGSNRTVRVVPLLDQFGSTTITITVRDPNGGARSTSFELTVNGVNDLPTITAVANQTIQEDTGTAALAFIIGDVETTPTGLMLTNSSSNPALVPPANIIFGGSGANRTVTVRPATNQFGTATITLLVSDGTTNTTTAFLVTVNGVNDTPLLSVIADQIVDEDLPTAVLNFAIGDVETAAAALVATGSSSNPTLVPDVNILLNGAGSNRTVRVQPATNQFGSATITVTINDGGSSNNIVTRSFLLTVHSVNDLPQISNIIDQGINEDSVMAMIPFTVGDVETAAVALTLNASSSNPALVEAAGVEFGGSDSNRTVKVTPVPGQFGTTLVTVTVTDGAGGNVSDSFELTVLPVNDEPTLTSLVDLAIDEDTGPHLVPLAGIGSGATNEPQTLTVTATSDNPGVIPDPAVNYTSPGADGTLTFSPVTNAAGTATITVRVDDGGTSNNIVTRTFTVTVSPLNDLPVISDIATQETSEDIALVAAFTIGDVETGAGSLILSGSSSNPALVPMDRIVFGGSGSNRTVTVTPLTNQFGVATITVMVTDGNGGSVSDSFDLVVHAVNDPPTLDVLADLPISEDSGMVTLNLTGITSGVTNEDQTLTVMAAGDNPALLANVAVNYSSPNSTGTLTFETLSNAFSSSVITLTVSDGGASNNILTRSFTVTVHAVNDVPQISEIANQTGDEDMTTVAGPFTIGDVETAAGSLTLSGASSNPALVPDGNILFSGSGSNRMVAIMPATNQFGTATITVTVHDGGTSNNTATSSFTVIVNSVNDAPVLAGVAAQTTDEDVAKVVGLTIGDVETEAGALTLVGTSSNPALVPDANLVFGGSGSNRTVTATPLPDLHGTTLITITVTDGNGASSFDSFELTVLPVNDAPTLAPISDVTVDEDSGMHDVSFSGVGSGAANEVQTLTVTTVSSDPGRVPHPTVTYTSPNDGGILRFAPLTNAAGPVTITVTVHDDGASNNVFSRAFTFTLRPFNDLPEISAVADQQANEGTPQAVALTIGDPETPADNLILSATSSKPGIVANDGIVFSTTGSNRTATVTGVPGQSGTTIITVTVTDGDGGSASTSFAVTIHAVNDPPTLGAISSVTISEDAGPQSLVLTGISAGATNENQTLTITATTPDTALISDLAVNHNGVMPTGMLSFHLVTNAHGTATITVMVDDGGGSNNVVSRVFTVTINPVNDAPSITVPAAFTIIVRGEDSVAEPLAFKVGDVETPAGSLTLTGNSSNPALVSNAGITFGGSGSNRTVTVESQPNQSGSATINVTVSDGTNETSASFTLTVLPINDVPTISVPAALTIVVNEDTASSPLAFTVGDVETPASSLSVIASSSNPSLVPAGSVTFGGSGSNRTATITPLANQFGTATITLTVSDGTNSASGAFQATVLSVNDLPTLAAIGNLTIAEDAAAQTVVFNGVGGGAPNEGQTLIVTVTSGNPSLIPNPTVFYSSPDTNGTLSLTPVANASGSAVITVNVNDGGASNNVFSRTFTVTVNPVNDPPVISTIGEQATNEDTASGVIAFTVGDVETPAGGLSITATSSNQALVPNANLVVGGIVSNRTVTATPIANQSGTATITVTVSDGTNNVNSLFVLVVNPVNDAPVISDIANQSTLEDTPTGAIVFTIGDVDNAAAGLMVSGLSSNPTLVPNASIQFGGSVSNRTVTITPVTNQTGTATITISVSDGAATATDTFVLTVGATNDPPAISDILNQTINEGAVASVAFTVSDLETAAGSLTVTVSSSNPALVPSANLVTNGSGANRWLTITPLAGQSGAATITVTVNDGATTASDTFLLTVLSVNDAPTLAPVGNVTINEDAPLQTVNLSGIGTGATNEVQTLLISAVSSNPALVPNPAINYTSPAATGTLTFTPVANASGVATIAVTVNDGGSSNNIATRNFTVTVNPTNDAPTISDTTNQTTSEDVALLLNVTVADTETPVAALTMTGASTNTALVAATNIVFDGSGSVRKVCIVPTLNQTGTTLITLTVSDGTSSASDTFVLTVLSVNDAPTLDPLPDMSMVVSAAQVTVNLTGITSGATNESQALAVTNGSSNSGIVVAQASTYTSPASTGSIKVKPTAVAGMTRMTVTVLDNGSPSNTFSQMFYVFVRAAGNVNPVISAITNRVTNEDTPVTGIPFTIGDSGTPTNLLVLAGFSSNSNLVPNASIVFSGTTSNRTVTVTPATNQFGSAVITVRCTDTNFGMVFTNFTLTVNSVNDVPNLSSISNQTIDEDGSTGPIPFTVSDVETPAGSLTVTASSSNPTLVPNANVVLGGSGTNRAVTITPAVNQTGASTITITATDPNGGSTNRTFVVTVNSTNDAPVISDIADQTINEDSATAALAITISDVETAAASLTMSASSSNTNLVMNGGIAFGGSGSSRTVAVTPVANQSGTATITVTVTDGNGGTASDTFLLTVNPVNDPPTLTVPVNITIAANAGSQSLNLTGISAGASEGQSLSVSALSSDPNIVPHPLVNYTSPNGTGTLSVVPLAGTNGVVTITVTVNDGQSQSNLTVGTFTVTVNGTPTISDLADRTLNEDTASGAIAFTVGDAETAAGSLTVATGSSNTALVPSANVVLGGAGASRTVTVTPVADLSGATILTITVTDAGGASVSDTFLVTVAPVNDPPTISAPANITIAEDATTQTVSLTGIGAGANESQPLVVTAVSSNPSVVPNPSVTYTSPNATGSLSLAPVANASGLATITVTVDDGQTQNHSLTRTFTVTVTAANDLPVISDITNQTTAEDASAGPFAFTVGDAETVAGLLTVTGSSSNPTLVPNGNIVLSGSGTNRAVTVTPATNQSGSATITVTVSDGTGTANDTFVLTVTAMNDAPVISDIADQSTNEDTAIAVNFTTGDVETAATSLTPSATSSNPALVPNANITFSGSGSNRTATITPLTNQFGTATIMITVTDANTGSASDSFVLTVNPVNDAPTIAVPADLTVNEDAGLQTVNLTGITCGATNENQNLSVTAATTDAAMISDLTVNYTSPGTNGSLTFRVVSNATGVATITVRVDDGQSVNRSVTRSFTVTINPLNDSPVITPIADRSTFEDQPTGAIPFTISDAETPAGTLTVSGSSSNPALVPNANIQFAGSGGNRTVNVLPTPNQDGVSIITIVVLDADGNTATNSFQLTVIDDYDLPVISVIADVTTGDDDPAGPIPFVVDSAETAPGNLIVSANSSNPALVPEANVVLGGGGANRSVTVTPVSNLTGTAVITIMVMDELGGMALERFILTVIAMNDAPTLDAIAGLVLDENAPAQSVNLSGISSGAPNESQTLTVTASSSDPGVIPHPTVNYVSPGTAGMLSLAPVANTNGSAVITVTVQDDGGMLNGGVNTFTRSFSVTLGLVELPTLNVERVPNAVVLSWPNPSMGFILERTMTLNVGHVWSTVTNTPAVVGQWKTVTLDSTNATEFYRLRRP